MRTRILFLAAAAFAASLAGSMAQNVYSVNIVGYINQPFVTGYQLIADQLDSDGSGTNNTIDRIFSTNCPNGTVVYKWNGTAYNNFAYSSALKKWLPNGNATVNPTEAAFVKYPSAGTNTFVGQVLPGTNAVAYSVGYNTKSFYAPISGTIQTGLGYVPANGDVVYTYNTGSQAYNNAAYSSALKKWLPAEPSISVGQGIFLKAASAGTWTQVFTNSP